MDEEGDVWYLAGPMSGIPRFNFPAFDEAARRLREHGYVVVSPAELDSPEIRAACEASPDGAQHGVGGTWGDYLSRDVKAVADRCTGVVLLPGWHSSRGARLEAFVAIQAGHKLGYYQSFGLCPLIPATGYAVLEAIWNGYQEEPI